MSQKKDIKRQKDKLEAMKQDAEEEKARAKEAARERVLIMMSSKKARWVWRLSPAATTSSADSKEEGV